LTVLYITQNGITDHIGRSQVAPYVIGLARKGYRVHILSAEKAGNEALIKRYEAQFKQAGVDWTRVPYRSDPAVIGQALTQFAMEKAARSIARRKNVELVHCRSHPAALIGYRLKKRFGVPYIFDFRDFYADGGLEKAKGPTRAVFAYVKRLERPMIVSADKIVGLTHRAVDVLSSWYFEGDKAARGRFRVIPCCADFNHFDPARVSPSDREAARRRADLSRGDFVLIYLGSLGPDYLLNEMVSFFGKLKEFRPKARFLFVCNNGQELVEAAFLKADLDRSDIRFVTADREDVPAFISLADLGIFFYRTGLRSTGCSPTKLAELLAMNVQVVSNGGVGDLDDILNIERNSSTTVASLNETAFSEALGKVLGTNQTERSSIRDVSLEFDVSEGVAHYAAIYDELLGKTKKVA
jgi:glycosyltransferase involved in cell wall biosynthesis